MLGSGRPSACRRGEEGGEGPGGGAGPAPFHSPSICTQEQPGVEPGHPSCSRPLSMLPAWVRAALSRGGGGGGEPGLCSISCHLIHKSVRENGNKSAPTAQISHPISDVSLATPPRSDSPPPVRLEREHPWHQRAERALLPTQIHRGSPLRAPTHIPSPPGPSPGPRGDPCHAPSSAWSMSGHCFILNFNMTA